MPVLKVKDASGVWLDIAGQGPAGATGIATLILGNFGQSKTPADLPPDGNIPVDWDAPGIPAHQMLAGESLIYLPNDVNDILYGRLHQFMAPGWIDIGQISGPIGPAGAPGPAGATGVQGPPGPPLPLGGATGHPLLKVDATDQNVAWSGDLRMPGNIVTSAANITVQADNRGFFLNGNGGIMKKSGGGVVIRKHSGNTHPTVENNDGSAATNIITANGAAAMTAALGFGSSEGNKLNLYGTTFGLGINASELALWSGGKISFRGTSRTGPEYGWIDTNGLTLGTRSVTLTCFANGTNPPAPPAGQVRIYAHLTNDGRQELLVQWDTGGSKVIVYE